MQREQRLLLIWPEVVCIILSKLPPPLTLERKSKLEEAEAIRVSVVNTAPFDLSLIAGAVDGETCYGRGSVEFGPLF